MYYVMFERNGRVFVVTEQEYKMKWEQAYGVTYVMRGTLDELSKLQKRIKVFG